MRLFTSIDLPEEMKSVLQSICFGVPHIRWLTDEQLHLTLVFIGELNPALLPSIREGLANVRFKSFAMNCHGIGSFRTGVLWLGVDLSTELSALERSIRSNLNQLGSFKLDTRKYCPHITLGRIARNQHPRLDQFLYLNSSKTFSFEANQFQLKSSELGAKGARHRIEARYFGDIR